MAGFGVIAALMRSRNVTAKLQDVRDLSRRATLLVSERFFTLILFLDPSVSLLLDQYTVPLRSQ